MDKLLLLPLVTLLSFCNGTKHAKTENSTLEQGTMQQSSPVQADIQTQNQQAPVEQGIRGKVLWQAGNQMPSPDVPQSRGKGIKRTVYIYELTKTNQTNTLEGVFHTNIKTNLVTTAVTDEDGSFSVNLKPGRYSLFTKEDKGLYANLFDGEMNIFPVEVKKGQVTPVEFLINYQASY
jgi:hypothetical protein